MMDAHIESAMVVGEPFRTETYLSPVYDSIWSSL